MDLKSQTAFDHYAAARNWFYDNGGIHRGQRWDEYACNDFRWGGNDIVTDAITIFRQDSDNVVVVHDHGVTRNEIWVGPVETAQDFDQLLLFIAKYVAEKR